MIEFDLDFFFEFEFDYDGHSKSHLLEENHSIHRRNVLNYKSNEKNVSYTEPHFRIIGSITGHKCHAYRSSEKFVVSNFLPSIFS